MAVYVPRISWEPPCLTLRHSPLVATATHPCVCVQRYSAAAITRRYAFRSHYVLIATRSPSAVMAHRWSSNQSAPSAGQPGNSMRSRLVRRWYASHSRRERLSGAWKVGEDPHHRAATRRRPADFTSAHEARYREMAHCPYTSCPGHLNRHDLRNRERCPLRLRSRAGAPQCRTGAECNQRPSLRCRWRSSCHCRARSPLALRLLDGSPRHLARRPRLSIGCSCRQRQSAGIQARERTAC